MSDGDGNAHVNENDYVSENVNERRGGGVGADDVDVESSSRRCLNFERLG